MPTVDAAAQYDILGGDSPSSLTNVLAIANAIAGYLLLHGNLQTASFEDALYQVRTATPTTTSIPPSGCRS